MALDVLTTTTALLVVFTVAVALILSVALRPANGKTEAKGSAAVATSAGSAGRLDVPAPAEPPTLAAASAEAPPASATPASTSSKTKTAGELTVGSEFTKPSASSVGPSRGGGSAGSATATKKAQNNALLHRVADWKDLRLLRILAVGRMVDSQTTGDEVSPKVQKALKQSIWLFLDSRPKFFTSGCADGQARVYDLQTGRMLVSVRHDVGARLPISALCMAPGPILLTGTWDGRWHTWDSWPERPARPSEFARGERGVGHENVITGIVLGRSGCLFACACTAGQVLVFRRECPTLEVEVSSREDLEIIKESLKFGDHSELYLTCDIEAGGVQLNKDDELLKEADFTEKSTRRDLDKLDLPARLRFRFAGCLTRGHSRAWRHLLHEDTVLCLTMAAEGTFEFLYSGSRDRSVKKWDMGTGNHVHTYIGHSSMVRCVAVNSRFLASGGDDRTVRVWKKEVPELLRVINAHSDFVRAVSLCPTFTERLATAGDDGRVALWDAATGERLLEYPHPVAASAVSLHESSLLTAASDKQLRVWGTESGILERQIRHPAAVTSLSLL